MKKIKNVIMALLLVFLATSCSPELPEPFVGFYRVSEYEESTRALYYMAIKDDNTFILAQSGGEYSSEQFIFTGTWSAQLEAFDFTKGEGIIVFSNIEGPTGDLELALTAGKDNGYRFYWRHDKRSAKATLQLESLNRFYSKDIATGFNITEDEFNRKVKFPSTENVGE